MQDRLRTPEAAKLGQVHGPCSRLAPSAGVGRGGRTVLVVVVAGSRKCPESRSEDEEHREVRDRPSAGRERGHKVGEHFRHGWGECKTADSHWLDGTCRRRCVCEPAQPILDDEDDDEDDDEGDGGDGGGCRKKSKIIIIIATRAETLPATDKGPRSHAQGACCDIERIHCSRPRDIHVPCIDLRWGTPWTAYRQALLHWPQHPRTDIVMRNAICTGMRSSSECNRHLYAKVFRQHAPVHNPRKLDGEGIPTRLRLRINTTVHPSCMYHPAVSRPL